MSFDRSTYEPQWQRAFDFVEQQTGGRITNVERQPRWRPAFFVELDVGGDTRSVYFRGARGGADHGVYDLRHEYDCMRLLEQAGILVPHVYGFCEEPEGFLMDTAPGRISLATANDEAERRAVLDDYMRILADIHRVELAPFEAVGFKMPTSVEDLGFGDLAAWEVIYREKKLRPEPLIEFALDWLRRNVPQGRERMALLCGDSGQFLFEDSKVTAVIDLELSYIGDPAHDLGALLSRDLSEPTGDLREAIASYEKYSGDSIDRRLVLYHAIRFGMVTPLSTAVQVAAPNEATDFVQYLAWYLVYSRCPIELIANLEGVDVPKAELPEETPTPYSIAHDILRDRLAALDRADAFAAYRHEAVERTAEYLRRADRYGAELEAADLDEAEVLLGARPKDWRERDAQLEALVAENTGELDGAFARYFIRHCQRQEFLLRPVLKELEGARMQTLE